jgi:DinB superfamily
MNDTTTTTPTDRQSIRRELTDTQAAYKQLVGEIGDAHWKQRSAIPAWTCGQLAWHIPTSMAFVTGQIESARKGKDGLNPPGFLMPVLFKVSEIRVRLASRNATPESVLADFDAGMTRLLGLFDATDDQTLLATATSLRETRTVAAMFRVPVDHFAEHAGDVRKVLGTA